ncbi:MAG: Phenylacetic acid catabolic protein [Myxococcota bacterium]
MSSSLLSIDQALKGWHEGFLAWARDVGVSLPPPLLDGVPPDAGPPRHTEVLFGESRGHALWTQWSDIPGATARDILLQMVSTQADCHMGGVEMQRNLLDAAPTPEDQEALRFLIQENVTSAAALGGLLIRHFPKRGAIAAAALLERRAYLRTRVLNAFNHPLRHWLDLMCFVAFVNLCAKLALETMAVGGFAPVAGCAEKLVQQHGEHARLGARGLARVVQAGRVEPALLQRYVNRWVALALDLFGWDRSETAALAYRSGLKGRVHEMERSEPPEDPTQLNDDARMRWLFEVENILAGLNRTNLRGQPLKVPPKYANRAITDDARPTGRGAAVPDERSGSADWPLPTSEDDERVQQIMSQKGWIAAP